MALRRRSWTRLAAAGLFAVAALAAPAPLRAEDPAPPQLTREQLKELVGPVALYPDAVLASLLPATTYPLQVVAAARWLEQQKGAVKAVPEDKGWDASVQSLLQFPDVVRWLDENLAWMEQMGAAVATQQAGVLQAIQDFRREAKAAGNLKTDEHMVVKEVPAPAPPEGAGVEVPSGATVIVCEPVSPQVVYVPIYDPVVVLGPRPVYPIYDWGLGFTFGGAGFWLWNDITWGWWDWHVGYGWWGGIYGYPRHWYWGDPHPAGWWYGPDRPYAWRPHYTSRYYPPRADGHAGPMARPGPIRPGRADARSGTRRTDLAPPTISGTRRSFYRSPTPSPLPTVKSGTAPRASRFRGTGLTAGTGAGTTVRSRASTDGVFSRAPTSGTRGMDATSLRGHGSLVRQSHPVTTTRRVTTPTVRATPRVSRSSSTYAPRARPSSSFSSSTRSTFRASSSQTRAWSSRGRGSIQHHGSSRSSAPRRGR